MALLNFQGRFVDRVEDGSKTQTIRNFRKYPISPGETLYLYTMLRTKFSRKLKVVRCKEVRVIEIRKDSISLKSRSSIVGDVIAVSHKCDRLFRIPDLDAFAYSDGFKNWNEMKKFWMITHDLPFTGQLIKW